MNSYRYGMKLRGYAPMCQPKEGLLFVRDDPSGKYWDILWYNRQLTDKELMDYELDYLEMINTTQHGNTYTNMTDGFTVRDLIRILENANPDALILVGNNPDDCEDYLYSINVAAKGNTVGFFTEPEEE